MPNQPIIRRCTLPVGVLIKSRGERPISRHSTFISDVQIMKAGNQTVSSGVIQPATVPETSFDKKLAEFFEYGKNSSKAVYENGEPKVLYH